MSLDLAPDRTERAGLSQDQGPTQTAPTADPGLTALQRLTDGAVSQIYGRENAGLAGARLEELGQFDREQAATVLRETPEALAPVEGNRAVATQLADALPAVYASTDIARPPVTAETIERGGVTYAVEGLQRVRDERGATRLVGASNEPAVAYLDRERGFPYTFHVRAFHPDKSFYGFDGDNRGFSTSLNVTSRVQQTITLDTSTDRLTQSSSSSPTGDVFGRTGQATPESGFIGGDRVVNQGEAVETHSFDTYVQGSNPLTPAFATPNIDVDGHFNVTEDLARGRLHIDAAFKGDNFPNSEAFVTDSQGTSVFIAAGTLSGNPITSLPGENANRPIMNATFDIHLDSAGRFTGVTAGGRDYTVQQWNDRVTGNPQ